MAKFCTKCQKKIGFLDRDYDGKCKECHDEEVKAEREKKADEKKLEQAKKRGEIIQKLRERIYRGEKVYLYKKVFKSVDSTYDGQILCPAPSMVSMVLDGINGWELVGTIPVTTTTVFKTRNQDNSIAHTGGVANITGVWFIMRIEMTNNEMFSDEELVEYIDVLVEDIDVLVEDLDVLVED